MNNKPSVSIIGSGVGGLFAGALLAKHGFNVKIFEARPQIGGYLTSWKRGDYLFETSMHELNGFFPDDLKLRTFRYLGIFDRVKFIPVSSPYTSVFKDGYKFTLPHNFDEYTKKLAEEFPEDKKEIERIMARIKKMSAQVAGYLQEPDFFTAMKNTPVKYPMLIPGSFQTLAQLVKKIKNPKAKTIITQLFCYYADNTNKMNILYFAMPTYSYLNESYYIKGTSAAFSNALADIIKENGGTIETNKKVTKILFCNKKACGVEINNGKETYKSDLVICNSSLISTFRNIIDKKDFGGIWRSHALNMIPSTSMFVIYLGLKATPEKLGIKEYCYIINENDDVAKVSKKCKKIFPHNQRPIFFTTYMLDKDMMKDDRLTISMAVTDNEKYWNKYKNDKEGYRNEKKRIADELIERAEQHFPGLKNCIEVIEIGTPLTMKKFTLNDGGAVYGAAQEWAQTNIFRFPNAFHKKNLYFSSSWAVPGGGTSGALISAINCVSKLLDYYGTKKEFDDFAKPAPIAGDNRPESSR